MNDFYSLKQTVLGCVSRVGSSFNTGTANFVDTAVNNALIYAQRKCDFEWNKGVVSVLCNPFGNIFEAQADGCQVQIKKVIKAFGLKEPTLSSNLSVPYVSRTSQITDDSNTLKHPCCGLDLAKVVHDGVKLYHVPQPEGEYNIYLYAVKWLPRLVKDFDSNFLLHYGWDFLMYRSIIELNFFIKEEERFQVSSAMVADTWNSLITWDASLISPTETEIEL